MTNVDILVLHGPNLNLLGNREPSVYGETTLEEINQLLRQKAEDKNFSLKAFQSNSEAELIDCVQAAQKNSIKFILLNPAAFTHTSVALRDALLAVKIPFIELHLSNVYAREPFRHQSYFSDIAEAVVTGFGVDSYIFALDAAIKNINKK